MLFNGITDAVTRLVKRMRPFMELRDVWERLLFRGSYRFFCCGGVGTALTTVSQDCLLGTIGGSAEFDG